MRSPSLSNQIDALATYWGQSTGNTHDTTVARLAWKLEECIADFEAELEEKE